MDQSQLPDNKGDKESEGKRSFLSDFSAFFDSLVSMLVGLGGRAPAAAIPTPIQARVIRPIKKRTDLLKGAEGCLTHMRVLKVQLLQEFGTSCNQFIVKSIDPMLQHIETLIKRLRDREDSTTLEEEAIRSVGLYSEFQDEKKLHRKIIAEAVHASYEAIDKDCQILANYLQQAERTHKNQAEHLLEAILSDFRELRRQAFTGADIRALFIWKSALDQKRAELSENGFQLIDSHFSPQSASESQSPALEDDEPHEAEYYS